MRILITGGAGFVGTSAVRHFSALGHEVTVFDDFSRETARRNRGLLGGVRIIEGDARNAAALAVAAVDKDFILHFAAQVAVTTSVADPRTNFEINALGTFNALEAARKADCGLVYTSTNKVYGNNVNGVSIRELATRWDFDGELAGRGIPESFPLDAPEHSPYGCSKLAGDQYVRDWAAVYGLRTVVNRMSCIYGPHQYGTEDQGWIAHFILSALRGRPLTIYGDGKQVRDVLFVEDLMRLVELEMREAARIRGEPFNVGGGPANTISLLELLELMRGWGLQPNISYADWRPADQKVYYSDISKAQRLLGWRPQIGARAGVGMLHEWAQGVVRG